MICLRLKASSCLVSPAPRVPAFWISVMSAWRGSPGPRSSSRSSQKPRITISRLLKSWATPPASRPTASIFCSCSFCASSARRSVMSS